MALGLMAELGWDSSSVLTRGLFFLGGESDRELQKSG